MIRRKGDTWELWTADGSRLLGRHTSAREAWAQEAAIQKRRKKTSFARAWRFLMKASGNPLTKKLKNAWLDAQFPPDAPRLGHYLPTPRGQGGNLLSPERVTAARPIRAMFLPPELRSPPDLRLNSRHVPIPQGTPPERRRAVARQLREELHGPTLQGLSIDAAAPYFSMGRRPRRESLAEWFPSARTEGQGFPYYGAPRLPNLDGMDAQAVDAAMREYHLVRMPGLWIPRYANRLREARVAGPTVGQKLKALDNLPAVREAEAITQRRLQTFQDDQVLMDQRRERDDWLADMGMPRLAPEHLSLPRTSLKGSAKHSGVPGYRERVEVLAFDPDTGKILVGKSRFHRFALPGGGVDAGERRALAARRETEEEAGVRLGPLARVVPAQKVTWDARAQAQLKHKEDNRGAITHFFAAPVKERAEDAYGREGDALGERRFVEPKKLIHHLRRASQDPSNAFAEADRIRLDAVLAWQKAWGASSRTKQSHVATWPGLLKQGARRADRWLRGILDGMLGENSGAKGAFEAGGARLQRKDELAAQALGRLRARRRRGMGETADTVHYGSGQGPAGTPTAEGHPSKTIAGHHGDPQNWRSLLSYRADFDPQNLRAIPFPPDSVQYSGVPINRYYTGRGDSRDFLPGLWPRTDDIVDAAKVVRGGSAEKAPRARYHEWLSHNRSEVEQQLLRPGAAMQLRLKNYASPPELNTLSHTPRQQAIAERAQQLRERQGLPAPRGRYAFQTPGGGYSETYLPSELRRKRTARYLTEPEHDAFWAGEPVVALDPRTQELRRKALIDRGGSGPYLNDGSWDPEDRARDEVRHAYTTGGAEDMPLARLQAGKVSAVHSPRQTVTWPGLIKQSIGAHGVARYMADITPGINNLHKDFRRSFGRFQARRRGVDPLANPTEAAMDVDYGDVAAFTQPLVPFERWVKGSEPRGGLEGIVPAPPPATQRFTGHEGGVDPEEQTRMMQHTERGAYPGPVGAMNEDAMRRTRYRPERVVQARKTRQAEKLEPLRANASTTQDHLDARAKKVDRYTSQRANPADASPWDIAEGAEKETAGRVYRTPAHADDPWQLIQKGNTMMGRRGWDVHRGGPELNEAAYATGVAGQGQHLAPLPPLELQSPRTMAQLDRTLPRVGRLPADVFPPDANPALSDFSRADAAKDRAEYLAWKGDTTGQGYDRLLAQPGPGPLGEEAARHEGLRKDLVVRLVTDPPRRQSLKERAEDDYQLATRYRELSEHAGNTYRMEQDRGAFQGPLPPEFQSGEVARDLAHAAQMDIPLTAGWSRAVAPRLDGFADDWR